MAWVNAVGAAEAGPAVAALRAVVDTVGIQVEVNGKWTDVAATVTPSYAGQAAPNYTVYLFDFPTTLGTAVRVYGKPGGPEAFVSCAELRVFAVETP